MLRLVLVGCGVCVAFVAGRAGFAKLKEQTAKSAAGSDGSPMSIISKAILCVQDHIGPWSPPEVALGLAAMAKVTEKQPLSIPGEPAKLAEDAEFLMRAQHWRALAEAVYVSDPASFSLFSHLPESAIVTAKWEADQNTFRPAYALSVDYTFKALVLSIRGSSHVVDILVNAGALPVPFEGGHAHGGFARATEALLEETRPHIERFYGEEEDRERLKLVIVGHSLGAAVGIMCGFKLRTEYENLECWGYSVPASVTLELAKECGSFATSFVALHDVVPRFSVASIEDLRKRICSFDWEKAEEIVGDDEDWRKISKAVETMQTFQRAQGIIGRNVENFQDRVCREVGGDDDQSEKKSCGEKSCEGDEKSCEGDENRRDLPALLPPGRLLVLACDPPGCGKAPGQRSGVAQQRNYGAFPTFEEAKRVVWSMHEAAQEDFSQVILSPWAVSDHMLANLCEGIHFFQKETFQAIK